MIVGAGLNPAAQVAIGQHPIMTQWLFLMSEDWIRWGFEGFCGAPVAAFVWYAGERTFLKRLPKEVKRFIPALAFGCLPFAAVLAAYLPGVEVRELAACMVGTGAGGSHTLHATANKVNQWKMGRSGVRPPKDPPGSPGDSPSNKE